MGVVTGIDQIVATEGTMRLSATGDPCEHIPEEFPVFQIQEDIPILQAASISELFRIYRYPVSFWIASSPRG